MIAALLGLLDVVAALLLLWPDFLGGLLVFLGIFYLLKGASSIIGSLGSSFLFSAIGVIDILAGLCFIFGFTVPFLWVLLLLWGLYCLLTGW